MTARPFSREDGAGPLIPLAPLAIPLFGAVSTAPTLRAVKTTEPPHLDGKLDDDAWKGAPASDAFTQKFPDSGAKPVERTTVRVVYDEKAIYIGVDCTQERAQVVRRITRRDRFVESDWVSVDVDSLFDRLTAYEFTVSAAGVLADSVRFNDTDISTDWDENWDARVAMTDHGWSAEYRIPLRVLRFRTLPVQSWGFEVRRYVSMRQETDEWAFIPRDVAGEVSHYGTLTGLKGLEAQSPFELRPFVLGRVRRRDAVSGQLASGTDLGASAGLDLKWHVTPDLTLDGTINPDFAQVEADQLILNLSTFETYYPEKRPFFLEGAELFSTPFGLLYTRRIGRAPGSPTLRSGEQLVDAPETAAIYGASKLTGRVAEGWDVGALSAVAARNDVDVQMPDGSRVRRLADPLTAFNVARVRRELGKTASVGFMGTATTRAADTASFPGLGEGRTQCPTGDVVLAGRRCFHDQYVGGIDGRWRSAGGDYAASAQVVASAVHDGPPRTLADGTVIGSGDAAPGVMAYAGKEGGRWTGGLSYEEEGRRLDYNDLGYMARQNQRRLGGGVELRTLEPWLFTLDAHTRLDVNARDNLDGLPLERSAQLSAWGTFQDFWRPYAEVHFAAAHFDDREVGDGTALERAWRGGGGVAISSDPRKAIGFHVWAQAEHIDGGLAYSGDAGVLFHALRQLDLELLPTAYWTEGEPRYVGAAPSGQIVFARLEARNLGLTARGTYAFTPRLTLQGYAQLFLASGHYSDFLQPPFASGGIGARVRLDELAAAVAAPTSNPDFESAALNVNLVLRWEYRLGSLLYLVYTRSQVPNVVLGSGQAAELSLRSLGQAPAADVVLLKLSYWFAP